MTFEDHFSTVDSYVYSYNAITKKLNYRRTSVYRRGRDQSCTTLDPTRGSGRVGSDRVGSGQKIYRKGRVGSGRVEFGQKLKFNFKVP